MAGSKKATKSAELKKKLRLALKHKREELAEKRTKGKKNKLLASIGRKNDLDKAIHQATLDKMMKREREEAEKQRIVGLIQRREALDKRLKKGGISKIDHAREVKELMAYETENMVKIDPKAVPKMRGQVVLTRDPYELDEEDIEECGVQPEQAKVVSGKLR